MHYAERKGLLRSAPLFPRKSVVGTNPSVYRGFSSLLKSLLFLKYFNLFLKNDPLSKLRRGRDSNPRCGHPHTRFPSVRLKPLGHLSFIPLLCFAAFRHAKLLKFTIRKSTFMYYEKVNNQLISPRKFCSK